MALTNNQLLDYSWMSQASYLDFTGLASGASDTALKNILSNNNLNAEKILATNQAFLFASDYTFINHTPNDITGFSATVFKSNSDNTYTLAVRGTEPTLTGLNDLFLADGLGVVVGGKAVDQLMSAFRYYKQITTPAGMTVQYSDAEIGMMANLYAKFSPLPVSFAESLLQSSLIVANDRGLGELIPPGATLNFTGHSLGGHVAYLLAQMVAVSRGDALVGDVATYNAPGQNTLFNEIGNWLGLNTSDPTGTIGSKHVAVIGEAGLEVTAGLGQVVGTKQMVFIEDSGVLAGNVGMANHSIVKLADSLAMYQLLKAIDENLTDTQVKSMLMAASNQGQNSLEKTLDALRNVLLGGNQTPTEVTDNAGSTARNNYYANIQELANSVVAGGVTIRDLSQFTASQIASIAEGSIAYRYALVNGNAFALIGNDALYDAHNTQHELDLYNPTAGTGTLTSAYLADRAAMLAALIQRNIADNTDTTMSGSDVIYRDYSSAGITELRYGSVLTGDNNRQHILFGSNTNGTTTENLSGGTQADHLYGMNGDDVLTGNGGADYLEGGAGFDTYISNTGDGGDTILDTDGIGIIKHNGLTLSGGENVAPNRWEDAQGNSYFLSDTPSGTQNLLIQMGSEQITVNNYRSGQLGITLNGEVAPTAFTQAGNGITVQGDRAPYTMPWDYWLWVNFSATWPYLFDSNGNIVRTSTPQPFFADKIFNTAGASWAANDRCFEFERMTA